MKLKPIASNMTEVETSKGTVLFSYSTPVAAFINGEGFVKTDKHWSMTTTAHINKWIEKYNNGSRKDYSVKPQSFFDQLV